MHNNVQEEICTYKAKCTNINLEEVFIIRQGNPPSLHLMCVMSRQVSSPPLPHRNRSWDAEMSWGTLQHLLSIKTLIIRQEHGLIYKLCSTRFPLSPVLSYYSPTAYSCFLYHVHAYVIMIHPATGAWAGLPPKHAVHKQVFTRGII